MEADIPKMCARKPSSNDLVLSVQTYVMFCRWKSVSDSALFQQDGCLPSKGVKRLKDSVQTSSSHFLIAVCFEPPALVHLTQAFAVTVTKCQESVASVIGPSN